MPRIHILGASGSGTTTLGAALGAALAIPHSDSDAFYWLQTDPPFTTARPLAARQALLIDQLKPDASWVLSGSATAWAGPIERLYDLIVYLQLEPALRMERLRRREQMRYGARIMEGGDMAAASAAFLRWAAAYDTAGTEQRSRALHEAWLSSQTAPVLRLDTAEALPRLVAAVQSALP